MMKMVGRDSVLKSQNMVSIVAGFDMFPEYETLLQLVYKKIIE